MSSARWFSREGLRASTRSKGLRYVAMGLVNTASTYLLYLLLLRFLDYLVAYSLSYAAGIALAFVLNSRIVFKAKFHVARMLAYPAIYLVQYLVNAALLSVLVSRLKMPSSSAPLLVIALSVPLGYLLNKLVLTFDGRKFRA